MAHLLLQSTVGVLVLFASNGALAYAAHLVARRFFAAEPLPVRWSSTGIAFIAFVVVITQTLSAVTSYNRLGVSLSCMALAGLAQTLWGQHRNLAIEVERLKGWLCAVVGSRGAVLFCAGTVAVVLAVARGLTLPPLSWDALTYHLLFAARYVQLGWLAGFDHGPPMMDHYNHFPINGEMMAAWLLLPFGTDLLVGVLSVPLLALGAVALYGLCRETAARWDEASLAACLVCFSPFLFAYVSTQDVDIQVFATLMCATLFVLRYLRIQRPESAVAACTAIGIAAGTKLTALALGTMLLLTLVLATVIRGRRQPHWRTLGMPLGCGLLLATIVGGRTYVENWWETGNPIYPLHVTLGGHQIFGGSPYTDMIAEGRGFGSRWDDLIQFINVFNYYPTWRLPTSAGPKFLLLLILALGSVLWVARERRHWPVFLLGLYGALGVCVFYLPNDGFPALARRIWPGAASRFLASPFALLVASAMPALAELRARGPALLGILAGFALWDMMVANTSVSPSFPLAVGVGAAVIIPAVWIVPWRRWLVRAPRPVWAGVLALATIAVAGLLQEVRDGNRWGRYREFTDVSPIPRDFVDGWEHCDQPAHPRRIALAAGWDYRGQNFFFYPLIGSRLQNTVVHIAANATDDRPSEAWLKELRRARVDTVFVQKPWPVEDTWMQAHPETFAKVHAGDGFKVYEVVGEYAAK